MDVMHGVACTSHLGGEGKLPHSGIGAEARRTHLYVELHLQGMTGVLLARLQAACPLHRVRADAQGRVRDATGEVEDEGGREASLALPGQR